MSAYCSRCPGPLDLAATLTGFDFCLDCERKDLDAAIKLKRRGQAIASAAHPDERARVDAAIRAAAATGLPFSANSIRSQHGVVGGVVGAAFTAARKAGLIQRIGREPSSSVSTHGHEIGQWLGTNVKEHAA